MAFYILSSGLLLKSMLERAFDDNPLLVNLHNKDSFIISIVLMNITVSFWITLFNTVVIYMFAIGINGKARFFDFFTFSTYGYIIMAIYYSFLYLFIEETFLMPNKKLFVKLKFLESGFELHHNIFLYTAYFFLSLYYVYSVYRIFRFDLVKSLLAVLVPLIACSLGYFALWL